MNITKDKIEYIKGDKVKTFKIPKEDRNINFKKWSFGDVLQYIKLTKQKNKKSNNKIKKYIYSSILYFNYCLPKRTPSYI